MGRYSRLYGGAAYSDAVIANQSYLAQGSVTLSDYEDNDVDPPRWEIEFAATIDSGLFVTPSGNSIERRFGSIALRFPYGVLNPGMMCWAKPIQVRPMGFASWWTC